MSPDDDHDPEAPAWETFDDELEATGRGRRLVVLAAIPWLVVGVLVVRTWGTGGPDPRSATPVPAVPAAEAAATPDERSVEAPPPGPSPGATPRPDDVHDPAQAITALRFGPRTAPGPGDAAAVAAVVARSWLGAIGPEPGVEVGAAEGPAVYVEHLAVEAVDVPTSDVAVVTLVAIVLDHGDEGYTDARAVRLAVPVALDDRGAHPAGDPWWLAPPDLAARAPEWRTVDDPDALALAGAALESAGYRDIDVHELASSPTWPLRVTATAVAPGAETASEHSVWLRDHLGRLVVAGAIPAKETNP